MPYIGNQHNVGDHVNNFKVLDDISSHTATFDGSAASVIDTTNNTIRVPLHRFIQGQRVTYTNGGGGNIGGLTSGTAYFVSFDSANTIKLATTLANANSNTVINISAVGSGTSHTLNVAFDGVNTKFKMTHSSGKAARLNNATQLSVAINNVIQRPNQSALSFTEGFALEDNHKIVFKTAPTVNDVFWGSIIANTIENFDLRDNEVDNFTGDGSTTEFTLSTIPANNESVIVSINGVVQHPSDKNTARSYTLIESIIEFTAAPALGDEIQVRHIGFAGASTNDVSGFYGRTGNVALISSDHITTGDITSRNINSSGIVTASTFDGAFTGNVVGTSATFTGNLTVGGVLTYEDVTNVDSVGIITAQKDVHVGAGLSVVGVSTLGTSGSVFLQHNGTTRLNTTTAGVEINGSAWLQNDGINLQAAGLGINYSVFHNGDTDTAMDFVNSGDQINFRTGNGVRASVNNTGLIVNNDLDVDGHTNLDNVSIAGVTTTTGTLRVGTGHTFHDNGNAQIAGIATVYNQLNIPRYYGSASPTGQYLSIGADEMVMYQRWNGSTSTIEFRNHSAFFGHTSNASGKTLTIQSGAYTNFKYIQSNGGSGTYVLFDKNSGGTSADGFVQLYGSYTNKVLSTHTNLVKILKDIDVDGHTNLDNVSIAGVTTTAGLLDINAGGQANTFKVEDLTSGRIVLAGGGGELQDSSNLTFDGTLDVTGDYSVKDPSTASYITHTFASNFAKIDIRGTNIANSNHYLIGYGAGHSEANDLHFVNTVGDLVLRTTQEKVRLTNGGDLLIADSTNSIYNDSSGGGINLKANGQIVNKKQATSASDPLVWLNDTGQTTNRTIVLAQDGTERGYLGLTGTSLALGVNGGDRVLITSDGQLLHTANKSSQYTARFVQAHADNPAWLEIDSPADNNLRPSYIQFKNAGTDKWGIGQVYNPTGGQSFHISTGTHNQTNSKFVILNNGDVGVNVTPAQSSKFCAYTASGTTAAFLKANTGASIALGGLTQPRILLEAHNNQSDLQIYTAGGSSWGTPTWSKKATFTSTGSLVFSNNQNLVINNSYTDGNMTIGANVGTNAFTSIKGSNHTRIENYSTVGSASWIERFRVYTHGYYHEPVRHADSVETKNGGRYYVISGATPLDGDYDDNTYTPLMRCGHSFNGTMYLWLVFNGDEFHRGCSQHIIMCQGTYGYVSNSTRRSHNQNALGTGMGSLEFAYQNSGTPNYYFKVRATWTNGENQPYVLWTWVGHNSAYPYAL